MATNEETIVMGGKEKEVKKNVSREWKNVAIGGAAGIMFGAGTAYAADRMFDGGDTPEEDTADTSDAGHAAGSSHDTSVDASDVASVDEGQSFSEAFAQARAEVGPGGVFRWHGGVYCTYTKDEWEAMSPEEQHRFSQNAMRTAGNVDEDGSARVETGHITNTNGDNHDDGTHGTNNGNVRTADDHNDVHVVGAHDEQLADGSVVTVGKLEGEGIDNDILVVDVNRDSVFDVAISDINGNGQVDEDEILDISGAGLRVPGAGADTDLHTAQNDIAPDMPDYMNDADVQMA